MNKAFTHMLICDSCSHKHGCEDLPSQENCCNRYRKDEDLEAKAKMGIDSEETGEFDCYHDLVFLD
jgi:hypothetical protein